MIHHKCPDCGGTRLKKESREVLISGRSIVELSELSFEACWISLRICRRICRQTSS
jgi:excinuclease UvrABC ATPase subunit